MTPNAGGTAPSPRTLDVDRFEGLGELGGAGRADVLAEMAGLFTDEVRGWLADASDAALSGQHVALRRVAHSLRGACATIGAERMLALAVELEALATGDRLSDAGRNLHALTEEFEKVKESLRPYAADGQHEDVK